LQKRKTTDSIDLEPVDDDLFCWKAKLKGAEGSPFVGGTYEVQLKIPPNYPLAPPSMIFKTKIFHPNIHFKVHRAVILSFNSKSEW